MKENREMLLDEILARARGCPDADELSRFDEDGLAAAAAERVRTHLADCESCAAALNALAADRGEEVVPEDVVRRSEEWIATARTSRRLPRWPWALAAAAVLVLIVFLPRGENAKAPRLRASSAETILSWLPDGALPRDDARLRWSPGPDGSVYRVTLFTAELRVLGAAENLSVAEYRVPDEILAGLSNDELVWRVEVFPPDGGDGFSRTFTARLEP